MSDGITDDVPSRPQNAENTAKPNYDVFLCYDTDSDEDRRIVKEIGNLLKERGIVPWLYDWNVRPGTRWQSEIEKQIKYIPAAAVFVGREGISPWQLIETEALLRELVGRQCHVIPVHLPNASSKLELPILLNGIRGIRWVDSRDIDAHEDSLGSLIWGITGKRVEAHWSPSEVEIRRSSRVLIASLGASPVAITALYDLLTERERLTIDQVIVLRPKGEDVERTFEMVKEVLTNACELQCKILPFEDINSWINACLFLKELYTLLDTCQVRGDTVFLSLADGSKSMAALMAWAAPFFSCVKHLYHIINSKEEHFLSINDLKFEMTPLQRKLAMHPNLAQFTLIDIPFEPRQQINQQLISLLLTTTEDELERMQYEEAEKADFVQIIAREGKILEALVTERAMKQFYTMCQQDRKIARHVRGCLERMQHTVELRNLRPDSFPYQPIRPVKSTPIDLHSFTCFGTSIHPVFYTRPKDIYTALDDDVEQVVICELDDGKEGGYKDLRNIAASPNFSIKPAYYLDVLPNASVDSVLIVPLDKTSMVPTQLYTLLKNKENRSIHEVFLLYPAQVTEIAKRANLIRRALLEEANVLSTYIPVSSLKEIDTSDGYRRYQATLEAIIDHARLVYPDCTIDLALSGKQEGIIAVTIFAAQNKHLPYVYHALITDEQLGETLNRQTIVDVLSDPSMSKEKRNDRLFLRAYENERVYTKLDLFKIPVFTT